MYIWIGCKLPESFAQDLRAFCLKQNANLGLDTAAFSLPQHISLKISFETPEYEAVLAELAGFLSAWQPLSVRLRSAEQAGTILWLPVEENNILRQFHDRLDSFLECRFGIPQHEFDKAFLFHSTLFIDESTEKIAMMREAMAGFPLPRELMIDTFLLGLSPDGTNGSYRVIQAIKV